MCAGCGVALAVNMISRAAPKNLIVACATSCLEVTTSAYPLTSWNVPWIHSAFETTSAMASGIETAIKKLGKDWKVMAIAGDGGTFDIGLQGLSGMLERGHKVTQVCLPAEEEIILDDGRIESIGDFIESRVPGTGSYHIPPENKILGWNGRDFDNFKITKAHKIKYQGELIEINTLAGGSTKLTPEHKVLVDDINGFVWKKAKDLKPGDEVLVPIKIPLKAKEFFIIDFMPDDTNILPPLPIKDKIKKILIKNYGSLKRASKLLGLKYWQLREDNRTISIGDMKKIYAIKTLDFEKEKRKIRTLTSLGSKRIKIKKAKLDDKIMYLLGLLSSDGNISNRNYTLRFFNKEKSLINTFRTFYHGLFSESLNNKQPWLTINNMILYNLAKRFDIKGKLNEIVSLPENLISKFLQGVFDGDGSCTITKNVHGATDVRINIASSHKVFGNRIKLLLQRIGIPSKQVKRAERFDIEITETESVLKFIKKVGSHHAKKREKFNIVQKILSKRIRKGKYFSLAPKKCGILLKKICEKYNIEISSIDKNLHTLATGKRRCTKRKVKEYLDLIASKRDNARYDELFLEIESLSNGRFFLDKISNINRIVNKTQFVYDITVDTAHSFVPVNSFVISNCVDNECYANTGVQRSGATPYGAWTTTSPPGEKSIGKKEMKKPIMDIVNAHRIPYLASASIAYPQDLIQKAKKAFEKQPSFLHIHCPCPTGWKFDVSQTVNIGKLAVETGMWVLYEIENGKLTVTKEIKERRPVIEYLKTQGRFKHLQEKDIEKIQEQVDSEFNRIMSRAEKTV